MNRLFSGEFSSSIRRITSNSKVAADEVGTILGVSGKIDKMGDKLLYLKNSLAGSDRTNIDYGRVREWVGQVTDILDLCHLKARERGSSYIDAGCFNPLRFYIRNPFHPRPLTIPALVQYCHLWERVGEINLSTDQADEFSWKFSANGASTSKSAYAAFFMARRCSQVQRNYSYIVI